MDIRAAHNAAYFDDYSHGTAFDGQRTIDARKRIEWVGRGNGDLLEVGCAAGHFLIEARRAGWRPVGVEQSDYAAANGVADGVPVHVALVEDAPLDPETFDVVCAWHVIEHLAQPTGVLRRLRQTLRPGGRIYLEVPNFGCVRSQRMGSAWPDLMPRHHLSRFTPASMRATLKFAGFQAVEVTTLTRFAYMSPLDRLKPRTLGRWGRYMVQSRTLGLEHPSRHDLLRATATA